MMKKERLKYLENARLVGMSKITGYHSNIESCHRMIEQNEKMIKAVTAVMQKDDLELLELQSDHDYENDLACEEYVTQLEAVNKILKPQT